MFQFPWSASSYPMNSDTSDWILLQPGFPIRTPPDRCLLTAPRGSFVVRHVLLRLLAPRHPPCALSSLTKLLGIVLSARCPSLADLLSQAAAHSQRIDHHKTFASVVTTSYLTCLTQVQLKGMFLKRKFRFVYPVFKDQLINHMVEPRRIELLTSCLQGRRSPS
jgi:hypothetical protein